MCWKQVSAQIERAEERLQVVAQRRVAGRIVAGYIHRTAGSHQAVEHMPHIDHMPVSNPRRPAGRTQRTVGSHHMVDKAVQAQKKQLQARMKLHLVGN